MSAFHKAAVEMRTTSSQDEAMSRVRSVEQPFASLHLSPCQFIEPTARRLVRESFLADITQLSATSQQSHIGVIAISPTSSVPTHGPRQLSRRGGMGLRERLACGSHRSPSIFPYLRHPPSRLLIEQGMLKNQKSSQSSSSHPPSCSPWASHPGRNSTAHPCPQHPFPCRNR